MMADYYFAYGSNLNRRQFSRRCPTARAIGRVTLPDFQLVFRGVADIVDAPGEVVEGMAYRITPPDERALDRYEGFPHLYTKRSFPMKVMRRGQEKIVDVMFYVMQDDYLAPPDDFYLSTIEEGYHDWQIPSTTLNSAVARAYRPAKKQRRAHQARDGAGKSFLR